MNKKQTTSSIHDVISAIPTDPPGTPKDANIADFDCDFVDLEWKKPETDGGAPITQYIIEKRDRYKWVVNLLCRLSNLHIVAFNPQQCHCSVWFCLQFFQLTLEKMLSISVMKLKIFITVVSVTEVQQLNSTKTKFIRYIYADSEKELYYALWEN